MAFRKKCILLMMAALLVLAPFTLLRSQSNRTFVEILNDSFDIATGTIMTSNWAGAQGALLSVAQIFNLAYDEACHCLRTSGTGGGGGSEPVGPAGGALAGTYPNPTLGPDVVGTAQVTDGTMTADDLATGSVGTLEIIDASLTAADLSTDSVGTAQVIDGSLTADDLATGSVGTLEIIDGSVTAADLGTNSVGTAEIIDASVTATDLATDSVGTAEIIDASVTADDLAPNSVDTSELVDTAVTPETYGSATTVARVTFDAKGRASFAENVVITATTGNLFTGENLVLPCILHSRTVIIPTVQEYLCIQDAVGEVPEDKRCPDENACWVPFSDQSLYTTTGIIWSATEVKSLRYEAQVIAAADECVLGTHTLVNVSAGSTGKVCQLPDPALAETVGTFQVYVVDANYLTLAPTEGTLINGAATPLPAIQGPDAFYEVQRVVVGGTPQWKIRSTGAAMLGVPMSLICNLQGGSTNNSASGSGSYVNHDLTCTIPANKLTTGSMVQVCAQFGWALGGTPPDLTWRVTANGTQLYTTPVAAFMIGTSNRSGMPCVLINTLEAPSVASSVRAQPLMGAGDFKDGYQQNSVPQPVDLDTTATQALLVGTKWSAVGTGTTTITLQSLIVYAAGLKH